MLNHMFDLPLHREDEERKEVQQQDGPENRDVEYREKTHAQRNTRRLCGSVPKFEFRHLPRTRRTS